MNNESMPQEAGGFVENQREGKKWPYLVLGAIFFLVTFFVVIIGALPVAFSADGGVSFFFITLAIFVAFVSFLFYISWKIFKKGLNIKSPPVKRTDVSAFNKVVILVAAILVPYAFSALSSFALFMMLDHTTGLVGIIGLFVSPFIFYSIMYKPWPVSKKTWWISGQLFILFILLPVLANIFTRVLFS